jgi:hypothetical protein
MAYVRHNVQLECIQTDIDDFIMFVSNLSNVCDCKMTESHRNIQIIFVKRFIKAKNNRQDTFFVWENSIRMHTGAF